MSKFPSWPYTLGWCVLWVAVWAALEAWWPGAAPKWDRFAVSATASVCGVIAFAWGLRDFGVRR